MQPVAHRNLCASPSHGEGIRLAALYSGGKDSTYALYLAQRQGHEVIRLISFHPREESMMFHVPNIQWTNLQAEALGIPLAVFASGEGEAAELDALRVALSSLKGEAEGIVTGAVASRYQAHRIQRIATGLALETVSPLWGLDPAEEIRGLLGEGFKPIFSAVAAEGFGPDWLGRPLDLEALKRLEALHARYGIHISGEGGEYETFVLGGPNMEGTIVIDEAGAEWAGQAGVYRIRRAHLRR